MSKAVATSDRSHGSSAVAPYRAYMNPRTPIDRKCCHAHHLTSNLSRHQIFVHLIVVAADF